MTRRPSEPENRPAAEQWQDAVVSSLKGQSLDSLNAVSEDGDIFPPLATGRVAAARPAVRPAGEGWQVVQKIFATTPDTALAAIRAELAGGAGGVDLVGADHPFHPNRGLADITPELLEALFAGGREDPISMRLSMGLSGPAALETLYRSLAVAGAGAQMVTVGGSVDPVATCVATGRNEAIAPMRDGLIALVARHGNDVATARPVAADGRVWHALGATAAQELGLTLAGFIAHLRACEHAGIDPAEGCAMVEWALAADADQLQTIGKFRAVRLLVDQVVRSVDADAAPIPVRGETAWRMLATRDANVNMLRATTAAFAAAVGGADTITVLPHSLAAGVPNGFSARVARNTQLVLLEETQIHRVADPSGGAGAIEQRTQALCERAWAVLQQIELAGGLDRAVADGVVADLLRGARNARHQRIATGKTVLTGITAFPPAKPNPPEIIGEPVMDDRPDPGPGRLSADFEALRNRSDRRAPPQAPDVAILAIGGREGQAARLAWIRNLLEIGGLAVAVLDSDADTGAIVRAFSSAGARGACLSAADEAYADFAAAAAEALHRAGADPLYIAARPETTGVPDEAWSRAMPLFRGIDMLAVLHDAHDRLKIGEP